MPSAAARDTTLSDLFTAYAKPHSCSNGRELSLVSQNILIVAVEDVLAVRIQCYATVHRIPRARIPPRIGVGVVGGETERRERVEIRVRTASSEGAAQCTSPALAKVAEQQVSGMAGPAQQLMAFGEL